MSLISKKDLLTTTGISYGQLYRWKRQGLIPEEWFIKKASYTGPQLRNQHLSAACLAPVSHLISTCQHLDHRLSAA